MARKNTLNYNLYPTPQSMAATFTSPATFIRNTDNVSYQIDITTTNSTGTFSVQVSNDYALGPDNTVTNPGTWLTLTLSGTPIAAGANDIIGISLNQLPYDSIRFVYTSIVAGTGALTAILTSKQVGG